MKIIVLFLVAVAAFVGLVSLTGCDQPDYAPACDTASMGIHLCPDGNYRNGTACATCDDDDVSLTCTVGSGRGPWLLCVRTCASCLRP